GGLMAIPALFGIVWGIREWRGPRTTTPATISVPEGTGDDGAEDEPRTGARPRGAVVAARRSSAEWAESLVREIAQGYAPNDVPRSIGNIRAEELDNARDRFAPVMSAGETPLALVNANPARQRGKVGFLLTDRMLYSSFLAQPIPLVNIQ